MRARSRLFLGLVVLAAGLLASAPKAEAESEPQLLVDKARIVAEQFLASPNYAKMRVYVQNAYAVLVVPDLLKGGFIVGGSYGRGVLLARDPQSGLWSEPAFFDIYGGSLGLQIGGQSMDVVFTIMNPAAVRRLLSTRFQLGADASAALGPIGGGVGAGTTLRLGEDIYVFSRNQGLYGGLAVDGTVIAPREEWNSAYYGQPLTPEQIVLRREVSNLPDTQELRDTLARF
jgi:SH3 domain-containing YSC84-like protein 1